VSGEGCSKVIARLEETCAKSYGILERTQRHFLATSARMDVLEKKGKTLEEKEATLEKKILDLHHVVVQLQDKVKKELESKAQLIQKVQTLENKLVALEQELPQSDKDSVSPTQNSNEGGEIDDAISATQNSENTNVNEEEVLDKSLTENQSLFATPVMSRKVRFAKENKEPLTSPDVVFLHTKALTPLGAQASPLGNITNNKRHADSMSKKTSQDPKLTTPKFAYSEPVRGKSKRQVLPGWDCPDCKGFYEAMTTIAEGEGKSLGEMLEQGNALRQTCSRHRARFRAPDTPPHIWEVQSLKFSQSSNESE